MIVFLLFVLLVTPAWVHAQEGEGPSLAEVARRERERRASLPPPPFIITNATLRDIRGLVSTVGRTPPAGQADGAGGEEGGGDADWQGALLDARRNLELAQNRSRVLQLKMTDLHNTWLSSSDGTTQARRKQQLVETQQEIEANQQEIQVARAAVQQAEREARAKGARPGNLRRLQDSPTPE